MGPHIAYIHGHMFQPRTWGRVAEILKSPGIDFQYFSQAAYGRTAPDPKGLDVIILNIYRDLPFYDEILETYGQVKVRLGLGPEMPRGFSSLSAEETARFNQYLARLSPENYAEGVKYLASLCHPDITCEPPLEIQPDGIYHPRAEDVFKDLDAYLAWWDRQEASVPSGPMAAVLCYRGLLVEQNTADIDCLINCLEKQGFIPLCIFTEGMISDNASQERYPWLDYLEQAKPDLGLIFNFLAGRFLSGPSETELLLDLNVPVVQLLRMHGKTFEQWRDDPMGISSTGLIYSLAQPEIAGVIEPSAASVEEPGPDGLNAYQPLTERLESLCRRAKKWLALKKMPNSQKRVTFVLHNSPCKGVEATAGRAVGLDVFKSLDEVFPLMAEKGYDFGGAHPSGEKVHEMIMAKKALSEFRWTTVEEIVAKGGDLHRMKAEEYLAYFNGLPERARHKVLADWDEFPGEGMVYEQEDGPCLLITGLCFGNIQVMIEPKRGCYGPKCDGEVCRILHDPTISPPHHWLATYKYIQDTSDVVVHFGGEGALEYLPGKRAALSRDCFSEISLGDLPNINPYIMDVCGEGLMAKRRARAVIVDHLGPALSPVGLDDESRLFLDLLSQYEKAAQMDESARQEDLAAELIPLLEELGFADQKCEDLPQKLELAGRHLREMKNQMAPMGLHVLGVNPDLEETALMLAGILRLEAKDRPSLAELAALGDQKNLEDEFDAAKETIKRIINDPSLSGEFKLKDGWVEQQAGNLAQSVRETSQFLKALDGGYIEPGLGGSLLAGQLDTLPTGRNFYTTDITRLPTRAAYERGRKLAGQLLARYLSEEGRFPQSVGISLWSSDAFKSDGEVFCQILDLYGITPVWESDGRVSGLEALPLEELTLLFEGDKIPRPRVDVIIQTSGIVRDMLPNYIEHLDRAATLAGDLDEPLELNYLRKNNLEKIKDLKDRLGDDLGDDQLRRLAAYRVFSSPAGSYGIGVGLMLDASAWETENDLAEAYVNWGGVAYGAGDSARGVEAYQVFSDHMAKIDVAYMKQASPEYGLMDAGCYAAFQGGMAACAKAVGKKRPKLYWADNDSQGDGRVRDLKESLETGFRARMLNKKWLERLKEHGFQGAAKATGLVGTLYTWSATTDQVDKKLFDQCVEVLIKDQENYEWLRKENPHALEEMTRRLLEAHSRGLWQADDDHLALVETAALSVEGDMEDSMGEIMGEHQGSQVDVITRGQVEKWNPKWAPKNAS